MNGEDVTALDHGVGLQQLRQRRGPDRQETLPQLGLRRLDKGEDETDVGLESLKTETEREVRLTESLTTSGSNCRDEIE